MSNVSRILTWGTLPLTLLSIPWAYSKLENWWLASLCGLVLYALIIAAMAKYNWHVGDGEGE